MLIAVLFATMVASASPELAPPTEQSVHELGERLSADKALIDEVVSYFRSLPPAEQEVMLAVWKQYSAEDEECKEAERLMLGAQAVDAERARRAAETPLQVKAPERNSQGLVFRQQLELQPEPLRGVGAYFAGLGGLIAERLIFTLLVVASIENRSQDPFTRDEPSVGLGLLLADLVAAPLAVSSLSYAVASGSEQYEVSFGAGFLGAFIVEAVSLGSPRCSPTNAHESGPQPLSSCLRRSTSNVEPVIASLNICA